jgi:ankyrin repeat protein
LIKHGINVALGDKFKAQALFRAAGCKHADVVEVILKEGGADPNAVDCFGQTALHGPAETDDVRVQRLLISYGADVNARGAFNRTALHEACNMGRYANVELLLRQSTIDVNVVDDDQTTPLSRALSSTDGRYLNQCIDVRIPALLLDYLQLPCEDKHGKPTEETRGTVDVNLCRGLALQEAAQKGLIDVVRNMVEHHSANIHLAGGKYGSALQAAAISGDEEVVRLLLNHKANPNLLGGEFGSPIAAAAAYGNVVAVETLLEHGANASTTGVGRYGSAYGSICKALKLEDTGHAKYVHLKSKLEAILKDWDGAVSARMPHAEDRWQLLPSGWGFNASGEL